MPKIQSNLENTKAFIPLEQGWYKAKVIKVTPENVDLSDPLKPAQLSIDWELAGNESGNGKKVNFDRVMVGGKDKDSGEAYGLGRLLNYVGSLGVPYDCGSCNAENSAPPVRKQRDYHCPTCDAVLTSIAYDTEAFLQKSCEIEVDLKARQKYEIDVNSGAKKLVPVLDAETGAPVKDNVIKRTRAITA